MGKYRVEVHYEEDSDSWTGRGGRSVSCRTEMIQAEDYGIAKDLYSRVCLEAFLGRIRDVRAVYLFEDKDKLEGNYF